MCLLLESTPIHWQHHQSLPNHRQQKQISPIHRQHDLSTPSRHFSDEKWESRRWWQSMVQVYHFAGFGRLLAMVHRRWKMHSSQQDSGKTYPCTVVGKGASSPNFCTEWYDVIHGNLVRYTRTCIRKWYQSSIYWPSPTLIHSMSMPRAANHPSREQKESNRSASSLAILCVSLCH